MAPINVLGLLWVLVAGLSVGDAATELMRMLAAIGLFGTSINQDRQAAALLCACNIYF